MKSIKPCAAVYLRVSTGIQETLPQDRICQNWCQSKTCENVVFKNPRVYKDETTSGTVPLSERPGGKALLAAVARQEISHLVVAKVDRLGRNVEDVLQVTRELQDSGVTVHFLDLAVDTSNPLGRFLLSVMAAFAEMERARILERIHDRFQQKRATKTLPDSWGEVCGTIPYGWQAIQTDRFNAKGKPIQELVTDVAEFSALKMMIRLRWGKQPRLSGKSIHPTPGHKALSYSKIAHWLNDRNIPSKVPIGSIIKTSKGQTILSSGKWNQGNVAHVLNNGYTRRLVQKMNKEEGGSLEES
jgi:site-specific DNA recombinase